MQPLFPAAPVFFSLAVLPRAAPGDVEAGFNPNVNGGTVAVLTQPDGRVLVGGNFTALGGTSFPFIGRTSPAGVRPKREVPCRGSAAMLPLHRGSRCFFALFCALLTAAADAAPGDVDSTFDLSLNGSPPTAVSLAVQPDGKLLFGGFYTSSGGITRNHIARLNASATLETAFNPNASNTASTVTVLPDGRIIITGFFTTVSNVARGRIARLNADGTLDTSYNAGANDTVSAAALQPDGKLLVGGIFTTAGGVPRNRIARLNADGSLDSTFNPNANNNVRVPLILSDGKVIIGGNFTSVNGMPRNGLARLNADGTLDLTYNPNVNGAVYCAALLPDGNVIAGGGFSMVGGVPRQNIVKLNAGGEVDLTFNPGANALVRSVAMQTDGKLIIGGNFTQTAGNSRGRIARLNANGTLDAAFSIGANDIVSGVMLQADGKVVAGGEFTMFGAFTRAALARLDNDPATQSLTIPTPARVQWLRSGSSPETNYVTMDLSLNGGSTWSPLGAATRIAGGWEMTALGLPASGLIRARARIAGAYGNSSTSIVESAATFAFSSLEVWRFVNFGTPNATGPAANNADPDKDGLENLVEFAFGLNPNTPDAAALPEWELVDDDYSLTFTRPSGVDGITYIAEYSTSMAPGSWTPANNISTPPAYQFFVPAIAQRQYVRVRVTSP